MNTREYTIEFTTSDSDINENNPAMVSLPFIEPGEEVERAGLFNDITYGNDERRTPISAVGFLSEKISMGYQRRIVGSREGDPVVLQEWIDESQFKSSQSLTCTTCSLIYGGLCEITYVVSGRVACLGLCVPTGAAYAACQIACQLIVIGISLYGCSYSGSFFCRELIDIC